jgi:hypothetical protein
VRQQPANIPFPPSTSRKITLVGDPQIRHRIIPLSGQINYQVLAATGDFVHMDTRRAQKGSHINDVAKEV